MDDSAAVAVLDPPSTVSPGVEPLDDPLARFDDAPTAKEVKTESLQIDKPQQVNLAPKPPEQGKDEKAKEGKPAPKPDEKKPEAKADAKPADKPEEVDTGKMAPKALREAYDKLKREMKEREVKHTTELETVRKSATPQNAPDPEKVELAKRYEDLEKRYKAKDEEIKYIDYTKSAEFQDKHYKPYVEQYQDAAAKMMSWRGQNEDGTPREITAKDFEKFMGIADEDEAEAFASKLLGSDTKTARAMGIRDSIVTAEKNMRKVAEEFRKTGVAKQQEQAKIKEAQDKAEYEQAVAQWDNLNKGALEKYPDWFTALDDDEKGREFLKVGYENVDKALGAENGMPKEEILARRAAVRNQAGAFRYMVHKWETTKARVEELEKELEQFKASQPKAGQVKGDVKGDSDDELPALLRTE